MTSALSKYKLRDAVEFGPFLIVNGKASFIKGNGGWGVAPRTVIGQRADGIILFLIIDGRRPGYSIGTDMSELTRIMQNYKAINAANLDGGASTGLVIENKVINKPCGVGGNGLRELPMHLLLQNKRQNFKFCLFYFNSSNFFFKSSSLILFIILSNCRLLP
jgi:exopolysaccharide biosynthesis protein